MKRNIKFEIDAFYHLYNRGVNRKLIFFEDENYLFFLRNIERYLAPVMDIVAYCLMPTHYHLLIFIVDIDNGSLPEKQPDLSIKKHCSIIKAIQRFSISYTKAINKRYERVGPLFQGSYNAKIINGITHSKRIIPYIHDNPVHAGLANDAIDWKYSSARIYERMEDQGFIKPLI